ncbi:hepatic lectin-like [Poeciliopsis prolifica]|uniref:hepatic lectin-like n=1 Tax=Poeciliopsis prolifica TaxID=188132 RepID=UPI00241393A2|nr:hepatic lectin-like [Poeciliopsis prolifica]
MMRTMSVVVNQEEGDEEDAAGGENPSRTCRMPAGGAVLVGLLVLLVLVGLLVAALTVIYRLSFDKIRTNQTIQTLEEENEALRRNISELKSTEQPTCPPCLPTPEEQCLTCLKYEAGWEKHGGNCYYFNTMRFSWTVSRRSCMVLGSDLVKIDSREEQMFLVGRLRDLMEDNEDMFWIGLTDQKEEGKWLWMDGSPLDESLSFWSDKEPNNRSKDGASSADCGRMGRKREHDDLQSWFDISCYYPQKCICEKTAGLSSCV